MEDSIARHGGKRHNKVVVNVARKEANVEGDRPCVCPRQPREPAHGCIADPAVTRRVTLSGPPVRGVAKCQLISSNVGGPACATQRPPSSLPFVFSLFRPSSLSGNPGASLLASGELEREHGRQPDGILEWQRRGWGNGGFPLLLSPNGR